MWRYQRPGFAATLLSELQRQQQCSQFCDTLLVAEGISVPVHSCVLSAVSSQVSSALLSMPVPPAGQRRLLEFGALGGRTLLHMVRLLYSGAMAGECDKERREAVSAAAMLGIHGLVEAADGDPKSANEAGGGRRADAGVQTEEGRTRPGTWRREMRDGSIIVWKEIVSDGQKDTCTKTTQTEELDINAAVLTQPTASSKRMHASAFHNLDQTDSPFVHSHIPYVPLSLFCQSGDNETRQPFSHPTAPMEDSTSVVALSYPSVPPSDYLYSHQVTCAAEPQSRWTGPPGTNRDTVAGEEWEDERLEQFKDNIPGFINYFLNPDRAEGSRCRRAGGGRGSSTTASERTPRGRRRGRLTELVDVQDVGASKLPKLFLQRGGGRSTRPGQGGGAVGRKLYQRTREPLKWARRRQRHSTDWDFGQSGDTRTSGRGHRGNERCGGRRAKQPPRQDIPPAGRARRARAKPAPSVCLSSPAVPSRPCPPLSPCPSRLPPVAAYISPAACLLHTSSLPPAAPPSQEEQPEHIDCLLEQVMMGLDILSNNSAAPCAAAADPNGRSRLRSICATSQNHLAQNEHDPSADLPESSPGPRRSPLVAAAAGSSEVLVAQQEEGELTDILDHFLQSFEQHVHQCSGRERKEVDGASRANVSQRKRSTTITQAVASHTPHLRSRQTAIRAQTTTLQQDVRADKPPRCSSAPRAAAPRGARPEPAGGPSGKARLPGRPRKRRGIGQDVFSSEEKKKKKRSESQKPRVCPEQDKRLRQRPVVRLERSYLLPGKVELQQRCPSPGATTDRRFYPIRSRMNEANAVVSSLHKPGEHQSKSMSNGALPTLANGEGPTPGTRPAEPGRVEEPPEQRHERHGEAWAESEAAPSRGQKRRTEWDEGASDDASVVKKACAEAAAQPTSGRQGDPEPDGHDVIRVVGESAEATDLEAKVDGWAEPGCCPSSAAPAPAHLVSPGSRWAKSLHSARSSEDEDVDVMGGSSPLPAAASISWKESGGECEEEDDERDEDVDVV